MSAPRRPLLPRLLFPILGSFLLPPVASAGMGEQLAVQRLVDDLASPVASPMAATMVVYQDPASGVISALRGGAVPLTNGRAQPAEAARDWLVEHGEAFGLDPGADEIRVERDEPQPGGSRRVLLRQFWNGFPVEGGDARCIVDREGRLSFVASGFLPGLGAPGTAQAAARVPRAVAIAAAADAARASLARRPAEAALWVRRRDDGDRLTWRVLLPLADGGAVTVWVDAVGGQVLSIDSGCANAVGLVYPSDPRNALAELPLLRLESNQALVSRMFEIEDVLNLQATPLGPDGDFRYPPSDPAFDQVNAYWHSDHYLHDFLGGLGYAGPPESLLVRVNMAVEPFVALTNGRFVYLGRPIPGFVQDVARCQDIIYHELTHAVIYGHGILPTGPNREAGALHEGLADYFAAALTQDPVIGEWLYLLFPNGCTRLDQPADRWNYTHYDQVGFAGGEAGSTWGNGMILSSGLWDLRRDLGSSADSLVLESLAYLPTTPMWAQFANAMLQADLDHHRGRFTGRIVQALLRRAIRGAAVAGFEGPMTLAPGVEGEFDAVPCCGELFATYRWRIRTWCRGGPCGAWAEAGEGAVLRTTLDDDSEIQLTAITPWGDTLTASRFVGVRLPMLVVEGPHRIVQHARATWQARISAMGPAHVSWVRQWRRPNAPFESLGQDIAPTFAADTSLDLFVTLRDGLGRAITQRFAVETFPDRPPLVNSGVFRMSQQLDAVARHAETTFELTRATPLHLVVYDVRGRKRETLWEGPAERGVHIVRWDAGGLEPGVYFLRLTAEPNGLLERFIVLR